jgi:hypothetical protein
MKYCPKCKLNLKLTNFSIANSTKSKLSNYCRKCKGIYQKEWRIFHPNSVKKTEKRRSAKWKKFHRKNPYVEIFKKAKYRAIRLNLPFTITLQDVKNIWPKDNKCPITGKLLTIGNKYMHNESPTLDRIMPKLGYVPNNIGVLSLIANACKRDVADPLIFRRLANYIENR